MNTNLSTLQQKLQALLGHYNEVIRQVRELRTRINGAGGSTDDANNLASTLASQHTQAVTEAMASLDAPEPVTPAPEEATPSKLPFPFTAPESFAPPVPVNPVPEPVEPAPVSEKL